MCVILVIKDIILINFYSWCSCCQTRQFYCSVILHRPEHKYFPLYVWFLLCVCECVCVCSYPCYCCCESFSFRKFSVYVMCMPLAICQRQRQKYKSVTKIVILCALRVWMFVLCLCVCTSHHFHLLCSHLICIFCAFLHDFFFAFIGLSVSAPNRAYKSILSAHKIAHAHTHA